MRAQPRRATGAAKYPYTARGRQARGPLLAYMCQVHAEKTAEISQVMERLLGSYLGPEDYELAAAGGPKWWHAVQFLRLRLVKEGLIQTVSEKGVWAVTEEGIKAGEQALSEERGALLRQRTERLHAR